MIRNHIHYLFGILSTIQCLARSSSKREIVGSPALKTDYFLLSEFFRNVSDFFRDKFPDFTSNIHLVIRSHCTVVSAFDFRTRDRRIEPDSWSFAYFYFLNFSGTFLAFLEGSSWISKVIFLNFSGRLLINSGNIADKNWVH